MAAQPASDADRAAKAALFGRVVEALPGLLALRPAQGLAPVLEALQSVRALAAGPNTAHQNLFRWHACKLTISGYQLSLFELCSRASCGLGAGPASQAQADCIHTVAWHALPCREAVSL